ncbi:MAG: class I SAM-dependent methyltransferase [Actinobacteria bacterium]|nr:class I SAM-dependent methyltransferase [Actinomycetota bacterium]
MRWFWAVYARVYDTIWDSPLTRALAAQIGASIPAGGTIVDIGCGTGLMTRDRDYHAIGIDTSGPMLRRAAAEGRIEEAHLRGAEATGLPGDCADCVLLCNVLHLHPDPGAVLQEALRLCRPGGVLFVCWPVDGLDVGTLQRIESELGRSVLSGYLAAALRGLIGVIAQLSGMYRTPSATILGLLRGLAEIEIEDEAVKNSCQHIVTVRRTRSSAP